MPPKNIENLIVKYLLNEASAKELDLLSEWIAHTQNEHVFEEYVQCHYQISLSMNQPDADKLKKVLLQKIKKDKKKQSMHIAYKMFKYAAVVLVLLGLGYFYNKETGADSDHGHAKLVPTEEAITIELDNGEVKVLVPEQRKVIRDKKGRVMGEQKGSMLIYSNQQNRKELLYNTLKVPYGKRFDVVLSDGTYVYLNAGTTLRYPVQFMDGMNREVYLTGEAYFDVTKKKVTGQSFIVHADAMDVQVLGTKFNVRNYPESPMVQTVLVEGSVELMGEWDPSLASTKLEPGYKGEWDGTTPDISVENVNTHLYTAWIQGKLIFKNTSFKEIRKALERKYNVRIKNKNEHLDRQFFDATFDIESIDQILESFSRSYAIEYKIIDNEVIIE